MGCRAQAQELWRTGLVAPQHVGSPRTRARTCVPYIRRRTPNHCTTREVLAPFLLKKVWNFIHFLFLSFFCILSIQNSLLSPDSSPFIDIYIYSSCSLYTSVLSVSTSHVWSIAPVFLWSPYCQSLLSLMIIHIDPVF